MPPPPADGTPLTSRPPPPPAYPPPPPPPRFDPAPPPPNHAAGPTGTVAADAAGRERPASARRRCGRDFRRSRLLQPRRRHRLYPVAPFDPAPHRHRRHPLAALRRRHRDPGQQPASAAVDTRSTEDTRRIAARLAIEAVDAPASPPKAIWPPPPPPPPATINSAVGDTMAVAPPPPPPMTSPLIPDCPTRIVAPAGRDRERAVNSAPAPPRGAVPGGIPAPPPAPSHARAAGSHWPDGESLRSPGRTGPRGPEFRELFPCPKEIASTWPQGSCICAVGPAGSATVIRQSAAARSGATIRRDGSLEPLSYAASKRLSASSSDHRTNLSRRRVARQGGVL